MSHLEAKKRKLNRLGKCDVCKVVDSIYTCPRCETVTCSLTCVKKHKIQLDCDGVRVRTKYVPVDKMNEHSLLSDYRLLEDIARCVEFSENHRTHFDATQPVVTEASEESYPPKKQVGHGENNLESRTESDKPKENETHPKGPRKGNRRGRRGNKKLKNNSGADVEDEKKGGPSRSELLVKKANQIRSRILKKNEAKAGIPVQSPTPTSSDSIEEANEPVVEPEPDSCTMPDTTTEGDLSEIPQEEENCQQMDLDLKTEETNVSSQLVEVENSIPVIEEQETKESTSNQGGYIPDPVKIQKRKLCRKNQLLATMRRGGRGKEMALDTLKKVALRKSILLKTLPHKFQRHYENTSFFFQYENCIYWRIKVSFLNADLYTLSLSQCSEAKILEDVIKGCLKRSRAYSRKNQIRDPLEVYSKMGMSNISILMAADKLPHSQKKFYELDKKKTLEENFAGKCIVEFPQFCIGLQDCYVTSAMKDEIQYNFFENINFEEEHVEKHGDFVPKASSSKHKGKGGHNKKRLGHVSEDQGRESGELTESSEDDDNSDDDSDEELVKDSEFRSIYTDLLKTFDSDIKRK